MKALGEMDPVSRDGLMAEVHGISGEVPLLLPGLRLEGRTDGPPLGTLQVQQFKDGHWTLLNRS